MKREEVIQYCLELPNTYEDYPFPEDPVSCAMKHKENDKWFALVMNVNGEWYVNVKTDPEYSEILRNTYSYIIPAYHMNKEHWNTIKIDGNVDIELVKELLIQSYELTKKKSKKRLDLKLTPSDKI